MQPLSKAQKKIARQIIEKGLQQEYLQAILEQKNIIKKWENEKMDNRKVYLSLYQSVRDTDKRIARRYDGMSGSRYLMIIAAQYIDGIISDADLDELNEENLAYIMKIKSLNTH